MYEPAYWKCFKNNVIQTSVDANADQVESAGLAGRQGHLTLFIPVMRERMAVLQIWTDCWLITRRTESERNITEQTRRQLNYSAAKWKCGWRMQLQWNTRCVFVLPYLVQNRKKKKKTGDTRLQIWAQLCSHFQDNLWWIWGRRKELHRHQWYICNLRMTLKQSERWPLTHTPFRDIQSIYPTAGHDFPAWQSLVLSQTHCDIIYRRANARQTLGILMRKQRT